MYESFGGFDLTYRLAADVELMIRFLAVHGVRAQYLPQTLVTMRMGGVSNRSVRNVVLQNVEIWQALTVHRQQPSLLRFVTGKLLARGRQFFVRPAPGRKW